MRHAMVNAKLKDSDGPVILKVSFAKALFKQGLCKLVGIGYVS